MLLQHISDDRGPLGRRLLQEADAAVPEPGPDPHTEQLTHVSLSCSISIWSGSAPIGELRQWLSAVMQWRYSVPRVTPDTMIVLPQFLRQAWCPAVRDIGLIHCKSL